MSHAVMSHVRRGVADFDLPQLIVSIVVNHRNDEVTQYEFL